MTANNLPARPYPGLRPFRKDEWPVFFGRQPIIDDIVTCLSEKQMVVVHGASGSGKSSVILAGVLPYLEQEKSRLDIGWRTASTRPGSSPLWNLATALARLHEKIDDKKEPSLDSVKTFRRVLDQAEDAPARIAKGLNRAQDESFCLLLDQFEEIFRYAREIGRDEAELLIAFLNGFLDDPPEGIHLIITMRSDYLGDCAQFDGFSETINRSQYLLPRMSRSNLLRAILEPANLYNGRVSPDLAQRILVESRTERDSLPLLQHALMRLWDQAKPMPPVDLVSADGETSRDSLAETPNRLDRPKPLPSKHLDLAGFTNLRDLLSDHADEILRDATGNDPKAQFIAEHLFRAVTNVDPNGRAIRRPMRLSELIGITGNEPDTLNRIIDRFEATDCAFLRRSRDSDPVIDIGQEALIRCWHRLNDNTPDEEGKPQGWILRELDDARAWRALAYQATDGQIIHPKIIDRQQTWIKSLPSSEWANRYGGDWDLVQTLIKLSLQDRDDPLRKESKAGNVDIETLQDLTSNLLRLSSSHQDKAENRVRWAKNALSLIDALCTNSQFGEAGKLLKEVKNRSDRNVEEHEIRAVWARGAVNLIGVLSAAGHISSASELLNELEKLAERHPGEPEIWSEWARGVGSLTVALGSAGQIDRARTLLSRLKRLSEKYPRQETIRDASVGAAFNAINAFGAGGELDVAQALLSEIQQAVRRDPEVAHIRLRWAQGAVNLINALGSAGQIDAAGALLDELKALSEAHHDEPEIRLEWAQGAVNLIDDLGRAGRIEKATALFSELTSVSDAHEKEPEVRLAWAKGACNLINGLGGAGRIDEATAQFSELKSVAEAHSAEPEMRLDWANGAFNLIIALGGAGKIEDAAALLSELKSVSEAPGTEPVIRLWWARGASNLIHALGGAGRVEDATALLLELKSFSEAHGSETEIRLEWGKGAFHLIIAHLKNGQEETAMALVRDHNRVLYSQLVWQFLAKNYGDRAAEPISALARLGDWPVGDDGTPVTPPD